VNVCLRCVLSELCVSVGEVRRGLGSVQGLDGLGGVHEL